VGSPGMGIRLGWQPGLSPMAGAWLERTDGDEGCL
jgi:hypothetical protein